MSIRRAWRSFDIVLLATLLALVAFGVTLIYSATVNTAGVGDPVRRQVSFFCIGLAVLLLTAAIDYRLLEIVQHPIPFLTPVVLVLAQAGLLLSWRAVQLKETGQEISASLFSPEWPALILATILVTAVFLADRTWLRRIDLPLARAALIVVVLGGGLVLCYLLTHFSADRIHALRSYLAAGLLATIYLVDCLSLRFGSQLGNPLYLLVLALLGATLVVGQVAGGAQSWLGAGTVQPSELAKVLLVLVVARFLSEREGQMDRIGTVVASFVLMVIPAILIYLQPDLGTALTLLPVWVAMIWMAGLRFRHLFALLLLGLGGVPLAWFGIEDYMRARLLLFLNPASDPDSYFNVHQALVSVGSGGWFGKGLTKGSQSQLHFLRVRHTDFIFAVAAEELGFVGALLLIALIGLLLWRMLGVAERSRDAFGRLIASGIAAIVLFQTVINVGMNLGLLPVTGLPLPFVSYGGSSLVTLMLGVGLVESVALRHKKLEFD